MSSEEVKITNTEEKVEEVKDEETTDNIPSEVDTVEPASEPVAVEPKEEEKEAKEETDKDALIAEAKALGITGNIASWKAETIIKKIAEAKEESEKKKPKIDPRVQAMLDLNTNRKRKEADKQRDIYVAMAKIKAVRS